MKILLVGINSKFIHSNLAIYSLRAYAKEHQEYIELVEYTINQYQEYILQEIYKKRPDVVAFSCYIWNLDYVKDLMIELKKVLPNTEIWAGGPEVSYDASSFLKEMKVVKGVMIGEGEATFLEVVKHYVERKLPLEEVKGITYLSPCGQVVTTSPREVLDMDTLPFVYEDLNEFQNRIIYYETSRGCPFTCSYCLSSIKERVRFRSFSLVKEELQFFLDHRVKQVKFVDRTFNANHTHGMNIIQYIKDHDNGITNFHFEIAADIISHEEIELLKTLRPGLVQLEIGVQSTNLQTIKEIDRIMDLDILKQVVHGIQEGKNIHQHLDLIVGLPFEDYHSFIKSFNDVYQMEPNQLQLGFLKLLKGSKMHKKAEDYGIVYSHKTPYEVLYTNWITYDDVLQLKAVEEMVEVYYNSGQFLTTIKDLVSAFDSPYTCFYQLAAYYERHHLNGISHTRIRRYDILLSFIEEETNLDKEYFKELLLYDLYLRENVKSRPDWGADLQDDKDVFKAFYQEEERNRKYLVGYEVYNHRQLSKMTHIERFSYDVTGDKKPGTYFVLFDYKNRDPLTYDATTHVIQV
ncbi:MAG TPA: B12-binding domain-containing radical SAM protein [Candidatus Merdenecus merdavium]|nr:B12-binding domain-containing radical SAM protein [Candidatus Merdenecus merdavium]